MSQGENGTKLFGKYRRAMILVLCVLNNTSARDAVNAVRSMPDANLYASLVQMIDDVLTICGRRIFTPVASQ